MRWRVGPSCLSCLRIAELLRIMKVKNIKIAIKSTEAFLEEAKSTMKKIMAGEKVSREKGLYFKNLDVLRKVLTTNPSLLTTILATPQIFTQKTAPAIHS